MTDTASEPAPPAKPWRDRNPAIEFAVTFAVLAIVGTLLLMNSFVVQYFVEPLTQGLVQASAEVTRLTGAEVSVRESVLAFVGSPGAVEVADGCNAVQVCMLLMCGILAFPAPLLSRVIGIVVGIAIVQLINIVRIVTLLYLSGHAPDLFDFFHLYVWDAFIVIDAVVAFLVWTRYARLGHT